MNLAGTVGFPYYPQVEAATMRDAVVNQAYLVQDRGTLAGIEARITQLTGWAADITPGVNLMLEDDQSAFIDPDYPLWNATVSYNAGELVAWGPAGAADYFFSAIGSANLGNTPPATASSNAYWTFVYYAANSSVLTNSTTGWLNTWEPLIDGMPSSHPAAGALTERIGIMTPPNIGVYTQNGLGITNNSGSTSTIELRSVSRGTADMLTYQYPQRGHVIGDGIPVPFTLPRQNWYSWVEYPTGAVVSYQGMPYLALKRLHRGDPARQWGAHQRMAAGRVRPADCADAVRLHRAEPERGWRPAVRGHALRAVVR